MAASTIPAPPGPQPVVPPSRGSACSGLIALTYALGATSLIAAAVINEGIVHPFGEFVTGLFLVYPPGALVVGLLGILAIREVRRTPPGEPPWRRRLTIGLGLLAILVNLAAVALVLWFVCCFRVTF
jgi:hypothetical protein